MCANVLHRLRYARTSVLDFLSFAVHGPSAGFAIVQCFYVICRITTAAAGREPYIDHPQAALQLENR